MTQLNQYSSLQGEQIMRLKRILLDLGTRSDFEQWCRFSTDENLMTLVADGNNNEIVFRLVCQLIKLQKLGPFLEKVKEERPRSTELKDFCDTNLKASGTTSNADRKPDIEHASIPPTPITVNEERVLRRFCERLTGCVENTSSGDGCVGMLVLSFIFYVLQIPIYFLLVSIFEVDLSFVNESLFAISTFAVPISLTIAFVLWAEHSSRRQVAENRVDLVKDYSRFATYWGAENFKDDTSLMEILRWVGEVDRKELLELLD